MHPQTTFVLVQAARMAGAVLAAAVVVLGAWVRLTDAGLGCPDWPAVTDIFIRTPAMWIRSPAFDSAKRCTR